MRGAGREGCWGGEGTWTRKKEKTDMWGPQGHRCNHRSPLLLKTDLIAGEGAGVSEGVGWHLSRLGEQASIGVLLAVLVEPASRW